MKMVHLPSSSADRVCLGEEVRGWEQGHGERVRETESEG